MADPGTGERRLIDTYWQGLARRAKDLTRASGCEPDPRRADRMLDAGFALAAEAEHVRRQVQRRPRPGRGRGL